MRLSLTLKLGLLSALLVLLVAGSTTYVLVFRFGETQKRELVARDRELAGVLVRLRDASGGPDLTSLTAFVDGSDKVDLGLVYVLHLDAQGKLLQGALNPRLFARLAPAFRAKVRDGRKRVLEALASGKIDRRGLIKNYTYQLGRLGQLHFGFDWRRIDRRVAAQSRIGLLILGVGLLLGVIAAVLLARSFSRPIRQLAHAMEAVAKGDLDQTVQARSHDELASLAASFNQMMRALRASEATRRLAALYLSAPVAERLAREEEPLAISPEERAITVAVFELDGLREQLVLSGPRQGLALINEYLSPLLDAVLATEGVVLRLAAGQLQVVWGALSAQPDAELRALRSAHDAAEAVDAEARRQQLAGAPALRARVGVASGQVALGNIGSAQRLAFAAVGRATELARRIAEQAQPGDVLLAAQTFDKVEGQVVATAFLPLVLEDGSEVALYRLEGLL